MSFGLYPLGLDPLGIPHVLNGGTSGVASGATLTGTASIAGGSATADSAAAGANPYGAGTANHGAGRTRRPTSHTEATAATRVPGTGSTAGPTAGGGGCGGVLLGVLQVGYRH